MRDQPHAWQHRSDDTAESATGVVPAPREAADDTDGATTPTIDSATHPDSTGTRTWAPPGEGGKSSAGTELSGSPDLDAPAPPPDVDGGVRPDDRPAVGVAQVSDDGTVASETSAGRASAHGTADGASADGFTGHGATADETERDVVDGEPVDRDVADSQSVDRESVDRDVADDESVDLDAADDESVDGDVVDSEPVDRRPVDSEPVDNDGRSVATVGRSASGESAAGGRVLDEPVLERSDRDALGAPSSDSTASDRTAPDATMTGEPAGRTAAGDAAAADVAAADGTGTVAGDGDGTGTVAGDGDGTGTVAGDVAAGATAGQAGDGELMPGDVPEQPMSALFEGTAADGYRDRWQRVQMRFVDNPRGAADEARALTDEVVSALHAALNERISSLGEWQSGRSGDTEELRVAVRRYRDLLDRLLGL